jgi:hypothetical protein
MIAHRIAAAATALGLGLALAASAAQAATATYTIAGEANGTFNGADFRGDGFVVTLVGDPALITDVANFQFLSPLTTATIELDGLGTFNLLDPIAFGETINGAGAMDQMEPQLRNIFLWSAPAFDITHSFGPVDTTSSEVIGDVIPTSGGDLAFNLTTEGPTLTITGVVTGGVPEPAAWTMMLTGFAGLGALLRRRRALEPVLSRRA